MSFKLYTPILILLFLSAHSCMTVEYQDEESHSSLNSTDLTLLQQLLTGIWTQANLPPPTTIFDCFDQDVSDSTVKMIGLTLDLANRGRFDTIHQNLTSFMRSFPSTTMSCIKKNSEVLALMNATGILSEPNSVRMSQLGVYVAKNTKLIKNYIAQGNTYFLGGNLGGIGKTFVQVLQAAFFGYKEDLDL